MNTRPYPIDHIAIAVASIRDAQPALELLSGATATAPERIDSQGVRVAFLDSDASSIELLEPLSEDSPVGRFLSRRGSGLHHIAFRVPDLGSALRELADAGVELIDTEPRPGARGHQVAFIHPRSAGGVLVELVER